jgi:hypothetical protein
MGTDQMVSDVLDETIHALTLLDLKSLQELEERVLSLAKATVVCGSRSFSSILAKKRLLELILQNYESNLDVLTRLHGRNTRDQWAH